MYVDETEVAAFAQEFDTLSPSGQTIVVEAASRLFDNLVGVEEGFFDAAPDSGYTTKTLYGDGTAYLKLPPYTVLNPTDPITIVDADGTELEVPEYYEQNGYLVIKDYRAGVPIRLNTPFYGSPYADYSGPAYGVATSFTGWQVNQKITVSARWGCSAIPADIKQAVIQLAIHLWRTGDPAFQAISQSGEPFTAPTIPAQAQAIADKYRDKYTGVVFA